MADNHVGTPTERDVVRLVSDGLANNDIAARLFVSPSTVQTRLTHVYTKLGLTSRFIYDIPQFVDAIVAQRN